MNLFYICPSIVDENKDKLITSDGTLVPSPTELTYYDGINVFTSEECIIFVGDMLTTAFVKFSLQDFSIISEGIYSCPTSAICNNNDVICSVGYKDNSGEIHTSAIFNFALDDVILSSSLSNLTTWTGICYGKGKYIAVGKRSENTNTIFYGVSSDGITWEEDVIITTGVSNPKISFGNNSFLIVDGLRYISSDGEYWSVINDVNNSYRESIFNGNYFISFDDLAIFISSDGIIGERKENNNLGSILVNSNIIVSILKAVYDGDLWQIPFRVSADLGSSWVNYNQTSSRKRLSIYPIGTVPVFWTNFIKTTEGLA